MMPLEKQSLGLFTHPFRYCRDNPHPPRSDSQFQQGMPQYLCRTGVPTAIHAGEEIKLGCSNGDISAIVECCCFGLITEEVGHTIPTFAMIFPLTLNWVLNIATSFPYGSFPSN